MKRWWLWLLVVSTVVNAMAFTYPDHDEPMEAAALLLCTDASSPVAASHDEHGRCNHSCHVLAHILGLTSIPGPSVPIPPARDTIPYVSDAIPLAPAAPPTHPPEIA